jgi:hypothetical protein
MFSKELENLIQATLEDGVLEENEKAALIKRAEREGVDIAELEIYINSLLQKRARELENEKNAVRKQAEKEKKEAFGRKCPNCGAQVPPLTLKCECGYEFTTAKSVSSVQVLLEKINEITVSSKNDKVKRYQLIQETIKLFPVPNTKEDIVEFLSLSLPNAKRKGGIFGSRWLTIAISFMVIAIIDLFMIDACSGSKTNIQYDTIHSQSIFGCTLLAIGVFVGVVKYISNSQNSTYEHNELSYAWRAKFEQVLMKGRSMRGDAEFQKQLDYFEDMLKSK